MSGLLRAAGRGLSALIGGSGGGRVGASSVFPTITVPRRHSHWLVNQKTGEVIYAGHTRGDTGGLGPDAANKHLSSTSGVGGEKVELKSRIVEAIARGELEKRNNNKSIAHTVVNTTRVVSGDVHGVQETATGYVVNAGEGIIATARQTGGKVNVVIQAGLKPMEFAGEEARYHLKSKHQ